MRRPIRILLAVAAFWSITAGILYAGTFVHEYSHYAAHEGFGIPEVRFYDNPDEARQDLVHVETVEHENRRFRMENVQETTIVLYDDALLYALTLNLLPTELYETGSLGATFLHAGPDDTPSIIAGASDPHWGRVMGAPLLVAAAIFAAASVWIVVRAQLAARCLFVGYAAELGNNAHHAPAVGMDSTAYAVAAEVVFGLALVTAVLLSPAYRDLLGRAARKTIGRPAPTEEAGPRVPQDGVRFRHARSGPPTPGRASPGSVMARRHEP